MAIRVRVDGSMWCAALTEARPGDTYIDDGLHYTMSQEHGVIVSLPMPEHIKNPRWWWVNSAPPQGETMKRCYKEDCQNETEHYVYALGVNPLDSSGEACLDHFEEAKKFFDQGHGVEIAGAIKPRKDDV